MDFFAELQYVIFLKIEKNDLILGDDDDVVILSSDEEENVEESEAEDEEAEFEDEAVDEEIASDDEVKLIGFPNRSSFRYGNFFTSKN